MNNNDMQDDIAVPPPVMVQDPELVANDQESNLEFEASHVQAHSHH